MIGHSGLRFVSYPISKPDPSTGKATINWIAKLNYDPDQTSNREDYFATATRSTNTQWSAATSSAWHTCRIRDALSAPILCTNAETETETETDSTESRFTALRCPIGSSPGSSKTSLGRPRTVVVHGAISPRRSSGIAASRDNTTTGRRPMSGGSHHQSSPRLGRSGSTAVLMRIRAMPCHPCPTPARSRPQLSVLGCSVASSWAARSASFVLMSCCHAPDRKISNKVEVKHEL